MINISHVVASIVENDSLVQDAIARNIINLSSYARQIKPLVEEQALKEVQEKSIVVALSRLAEDYHQDNMEEREVILQNISVQSGLADYTYEKTIKNIEKLRSLEKIIPESMNSFFMATQSIGEITIIAEAVIMKKVQLHFTNSIPIFTRDSLTGVTAKFDVKYLALPNVIYALTKQLAMKNINLIEIVSTTTEITFIVDKKYTALTVSQLSKAFMR